MGTPSIVTASLAANVGSKSTNRSWRGCLGRSTAALTVVVVLALPASAQVTSADEEHRHASHPDPLGMTAPPEFLRDADLPRSRPALDGATDREARSSAARVDVDPHAPADRDVAQFEDTVVVMRIAEPLRTAELDFEALAARFHEYYPDRFDWIVYVSNLPTRDDNEHYTYYGKYYRVTNAVTGTGLAVSGSGRLKGNIHLPYRTALLRGPALHEFMHSWASYAVPTARTSHWGFSSAHGQLGGFDIDDLVNLGNGRYSAGRFGTIANGGNSVPYSPVELYLAGLIPPGEVPPLWVAEDGEWTDELDESGNLIFSASDVEVWTVRRIVREHGSRVPNWLNSQKSFRAAVVLLVDDEFPATPAILRYLADAVRMFSHPGPDDSRLFNFWEATGGRATLRMDGLRGSAGPIDLNRAPQPVGALPPLTLGAGEAAVVDAAAAFRDPDGDALTYRAASSAPGVAAATVSGTAVRVRPAGPGTATVTVSATDGGGLSATQAFGVTVSPSNRSPVPVGALPPLTLGVGDAAVLVEVAGAFRDPDGDALTYGASSSAPSVAGVSVSGSVVTVTPASEGTVLVTVTATDAGGSNTTATQSFAATVVGAGPFTDHPLVAGVTPVRAVHFTELRERTDALRVAWGLGPFAWTDRVLTAGVTPMRLAHLLELRWALEAAYDAAGRAAPRWTDPAPAAGATPIRAAHVMELRAAVAALE